MPEPDTVRAEDRPRRADRAAPARGRWLVACIVLLWLGSSGWLVFCEAYPGLLRRATSGYRSLLGRGLVVLDQWMLIRFQGRPIGYTHTAVDVNEADPRQQYLLSNRTLLHLNLMGVRQRISVAVHATVDARYRLQEFSFVLRSGEYALNLQGRRRMGETFGVMLTTPGNVQHLEVRIPDDAVLYSPLTEMQLKTLAPGQQTQVRIFNPLTLAAEAVTVRALRREALGHAGRQHETVVLAVEAQGMETLVWVDGEGRALREATPFGWTLEACTAEEALAAKGVADGDLLAALAVPAAGDTTRLPTAAGARLILRGATLDADDVTSHRQTVVAATNDVMTLTVRADRLPDRSTSLGDVPPECAAYLQPSPFVQSDDPRMVARVRELVGDRTNSLEAALAIYRWVHENVEKTPAVTLPSALDVLLNPRGDCNEHTYLFVALARAAGLPAKIRVGLTLNNGLFYYHAWPSVYVGRWLDMDPTLGRPAVGAAYVSLLEGELAQQMKLMAVLGRLRIEVRETFPALPAVGEHADDSD